MSSRPPRNFLVEWQSTLLWQKLILKINSIIAGYSSGIEPLFAISFTRNVLAGTAFDVTAREHLYIQAAFQRFTDNSVSKTVNLPARARVEDVKKRTGAFFSRISYC